MPYERNGYDYLRHWRENDKWHQLVRCHCGAEFEGESADTSARARVRAGRKVSQHRKDGECSKD